MQGDDAPHQGSTLSLQRTPIGYIEMQRHHAPLQPEIVHSQAWAYGTLVVYMPCTSERRRLADDTFEAHRLLLTLHTLISLTASTGLKELS